MLRRTLVLTVMLLQPVLWGGDVKLNKARTFTHPGLKMTVVHGECKLSQEAWHVAGGRTVNGLSDIQLYAADPPEERGRRHQLFVLDRNISRAEWRLRRLVGHVCRYAAEHGKIGPASYQDLAAQQYFDVEHYLGNPWSHIFADPTDRDALVRKLLEQKKADDKVRANEIPAAETPYNETQREVYRLQGEESDLSTKQADLQKRLAASQKAGKEDAPLGKHLQAVKVELEAVRAALAEARAERKLIMLETGKVRARHTQQILTSAREIADARRAALKKMANAKDLTGPYMVLVPKADTSKPDTPVVIELRPFINDGLHYVGYADGRVKRVKVDTELMKRLELTVRPMQEKAIATVKKGPAKHLFYALLDPGKKGLVRLPLAIDGKTVDTALTLDLAQAGAGDAKIFKDWSSARASLWSHQAGMARTSIVGAWAILAPKVYGEEGVDDTRTRRNRRQGRQTSVFGILGGRAAIRETLQMQLLEGAGDNIGERTIPIDKIVGVKVKSHPFKQMLGNRPGGRLPMADCVPEDRFMVYFAKPEHLATYLGKGSKFTFQSSSVATRSSLNYDLQGKYSARLGLGTGWSKLVLETKAVKELVVFMPDLFLIDGTDITIAMRVPKLQLLQPALRVIGVSGLDKGTIVAKKLPEGGASEMTSFTGSVEYLSPFTETPNAGIGWVPSVSAWNRYWTVSDWVVRWLMTRMEVDDPLPRNRANALRSGTSGSESRFWDPSICRFSVKVWPTPTDSGFR